MPKHLNGTELNNRFLQYDGTSVIEAELAKDLLLRCVPVQKIAVPEFTSEIIQFNEQVHSSEQIKLRSTEQIQHDFSWNIPQKYLSIDIEEHVIDLFLKKLPDLNYSTEQTEIAINRIDLELTEFRSKNLFNVLRCIIYVLDTFKQNDVLYGIGRGSSCASFILFLLGLHVIDVIKFNVNFSEFMHN